MAVPNSFRAPAQHGEIFLGPPGSFAEVVRANESSLGSHSEIAAIRELARTEILSVATRWTNDLTGSVPPPPASHMWVIGGHQPELFHPGVWVKNSVIDALATVVGGVGLNLVVDNDLSASASVSVPHSPETQQMATLEWDRPRLHSPWEERLDPDAALMSTFGDRCQQHLQPWGIEPLAALQDWGGSPQRGVVDRLARIRVQFERDCGLRNLEIKVSDLADTQSFRRFLLHALRNADSLRQTYNSALHDYRSLHHIRSRSHPVPVLDVTEHGIEVPFWVWKSGETQRGRLYVRRASADQLVLHDGRREIATISAVSESSAQQSLASLRQQGWKIRPRALMLTLFSRVYLGSVFVHGIGGAKYDEMTDVLIERWLGIQPPALIVATATLRLFESFVSSPVEPLIEHEFRELRRIRWNPESISTTSHASANSVDLIAQKRQLLAQHATDASRHAQIQKINTSLRAGLTDYEQNVRHNLQTHLAAMPYQKALRSREFAANLFPAATIKSMFEGARQMVARRK